MHISQLRTFHIGIATLILILVKFGAAVGILIFLQELQTMSFIHHKMFNQVVVRIGCMHGQVHIFSRKKNFTYLLLDIKLLYVFPSFCLENTLE